MRAKVLIVDDEELVLEGLQRALHGTAYEVSTAIGAWAGVDALRRGHPDIVVVDQCMPGMTGLDLLEVVRELRPQAIRILLSGRADLETAMSALNQGEVFPFLTKPVDRTELLVTLGLAFSRAQSAQETLRLREAARRPEDGRPESAPREKRPRRPAR